MVDNRCGAGSGFRVTSGNALWRRREKEESPVNDGSKARRRREGVKVRSSAEGAWLRWKDSPLGEGKGAGEHGWGMVEMGRGRSAGAEGGESSITTASCG